MYHTHTLGELYVFIYKISWEAIYQMQSKLQNNSTPQTHCPSPGCSPHSRHTRTLTHTCLCSLTPGKKSSTLHNLATWEMFMLMPQMHSGRGRAPSCTGLNSTRVLQAAARKRFCLQGPTAWGSRSGEGGFAGLGRLTGELSWGVWSGVRDRREADARVQIRKCVRVNKCFYVLHFLPPLHCGM